MRAFDGPFKALTEYKQFILWEAVPRPEGRVDKVPIDWRTGRNHSAHDPKIWLSAKSAATKAKALKLHIGFTFTDEDPFFFLDIDKCMETDGTWSPLALELLDKMHGCAVEVSHSKKALHVFGTGRVPRHSCKNTALKLELYTSKHFVALTGRSATGDAGFDASAVLPDLVYTYFNPGPGATIDASGESIDYTTWTTEAVAGYRCTLDDAALIERACNSKSDFKIFWENAEEEIAKKQGGEGVNASNADMSLINRLLWWTGGNCERTLQLVRKSALARDKWQRETYLPNSIMKARAMISGYYSVASPAPSTTNNAIELKTGNQFLDAAAQQKHFANCVYVKELHRIFTPRGDLLKPEQFNVMFGGFTFLRDGDSKTTRKAWDAFTESQILKTTKVDRTIFDPTKESGSVIERDGSTEVNVYVEAVTERREGDASLFEDHVKKLLPDEKDQETLISYLAACVQHKGVKFQWAPVIQGVEGNGKTLLTRCVEFAVGERHSHYPSAEDLHNRFNAWLLNKIFIGVEDIYVPQQRREVLEVLKPMITSDRIEIQPKGDDKFTARICCNFIFNSNHRDAIQTTRNARRFTVFYTAQQSVDDLERDGMNAAYFKKLYGWLNNENGYSIVNNFLSEYKISDELNPALGGRAPETSTTAQAVKESLGRVEQEILEAVEEGQTGFCGGWISSIAVDRLLQQTGLARMIPHNKRREMLETLDYAWHPALVDGRSNVNILVDDNKKPKLFIKKGHVSCNITIPGDAVRAYRKSQGDVSMSESIGDWGNG